MLEWTGLDTAATPYCGGIASHIAQIRKGRPVTSTRFASGLIIISLLTALSVAGCNNDSTDSSVARDPLNGAWVDGVDTGVIKVYVTELRFNNGAFEWTWDHDLQQRGVYDTAAGILTVTVEHNYGSPQRLLGDYSSPYSILSDTLTWGGWRLTRK